MDFDAALPVELLKNSPAIEVVLASVLVSVIEEVIPLKVPAVVFGL